MRVKTIIGKSNVDGLQLMDKHVNSWMEEDNIRPLHVTQTFGHERIHGGDEECVIITSIWYDDNA